MLCVYCGGTIELIVMYGITALSVILPVVGQRAALVARRAGLLKRHNHHHHPENR